MLPQVHTQGQKVAITPSQRLCSMITSSSTTPNHLNYADIIGGCIASNAVTLQFSGKSRVPEFLTPKPTKDNTS